MADVVLTCDGESGDVNLEGIVADVFKEVFLLWKERQAKYGHHNISAFGEVGCLVRGHDKMARLRNALVDGKGTNSTDESISDSWLDLANYAVMGLVCRRGQWPGVEKNDGIRG